MDDERRPDPDVLLRKVQAEEARRTRARLRIYFGYSPGVGKTYTMLEVARLLRADGADVVVGCVETHGRPETAALLEGLEALPRRAVEHHGTLQQEFDLDAALARKPKVLLLDELAHANAAGSRHPKRWQDAIELLESGIDVWTTLNVQHVESLNDVVAQITFVRVRETVPDAVLDRADELELVDLPPDQLLARLGEGKVHLPEQARRAADNFFRRGNLLALRELALRRTAERVDVDVAAYRHQHEIRSTWAAGERILVCVGPSPTSASLLRGGRRMAAGLRAPWVAAYVEAPGAFALTGPDRDRLQANLRLAESLGGEVVRLTGASASGEILRYAREHNVTRIVVGKPTHRRWRDVLRGSFVSELVRGSGTIEVHFIAGDEGGAEDSPARRGTAARRVDWLGYGTAAAGVAAISGLGVGLRDVLSLPDVAVLFLLLIMVVAMRFGRWPALAASALSVAAYDFCFVPPFYTMSVHDARHFLTFAMMFAVGLVISALADRLRRQERAARAREARTAALHALSRELVGATDARQVARIAARQAGAALGGEAAVLLPDGPGGTAAGFVAEGTLRPGEDVLSVARWAFEHARPAGRGTDTLPASPAICFPLLSGTRTLGVLAVRSPAHPPDDPESRSHIDAFLRQTTLALERARFEEEAQAAALRARTEEMRSSLLSAVSHDLRTPLAAITGAATTLRDDPDRLGSRQRRELTETICGEAERMGRLIGNLLDMMRLESGRVSPRREWVPLEDVVGSALGRLESRLEGRDVRTDLPDDLPLVSIDPVLFEQLFVNLLENAARHTPREARIELLARVGDGRLEVEVADRGPGLPAGEEERVFEKFHRGPHAGAGGVGLGLPICRAIAEAHGGTIAAANREGGGASFRIVIPAGVGSAGGPDPGGLPDMLPEAKA
ncbi:MAG: sensor histidine kinase KdpD [Deltaproteobacteria bacterium]|nr:sensor histidine kinase KdpD [Deltaproteobacteria bacterium]